MAPSDMVIALNERDQVIAIASPDVLLGHIVSHLPTARAVTGVSDPGGRNDHVIEFFDEGGAILEVLISHAWHSLEFADSGRRADLGELRRRMEGVIDQRFAAIGHQSAAPRVQKPTGATWPEFLQSCAELVNGRQRVSTTGGRPDGFDRRGWWHNTFVHGGKV